MKRLLGLLLILWPAAIFAGTTYYVDATCPTAGNGTSATCSSGVTTNNPKRLLQDGINLLTTAGDILNVRGIHTAHNTGGENCPGDTEGRYYSDQFTLSVNITGAGATIQPYGYTGVGTGETVYIDGTQFPTSGWTQCTDCSAGSAQIRCRNVPGTCGDAYYTIEPNSGTAQRAIGAQKRDGTPTYRVIDPRLCTGSGSPQACCTGAGTGCGLSDLTNAHAGYTGTSPEIDSTSEQQDNGHCVGSGNPAPCCSGAGTGTCNWITVKWAGQAPGNTAGNRSYIYQDNNGVGFAFNSNVGGYTIRGLNVRAHRRQAFGISGGTGNAITITDNRVLYNVDTYGNGSDYGVGLYLSTGVTISNNEFGWMGSEAIHEQGKVGGVSANIITGNWIHDSGDRNVLGPAACGTPSGMILTDDGTGGLSDYTGSVTSGNLIVNMNDNSPGCSAGRGIILENNTQNMIVRDNVIKGTAAEGIKIDPSSSGHGDGHQLFNNLIISNGGGGNGNAFWVAPAGAGGTANNNLFYNNTCFNPQSACLGDNGVGTRTGNVFRNNIFFSTSSQQLVGWSGGGTFTNNDVKSTTSGTLVAFNGSNYTCANIGTLGTGNICSDPLFASTSTPDLHILSTSPAKDVGTSTGMPSARTSDINNTLSGAHGLPAYNDNQTIQNGTWDIGADEIGGSAPVLVISKTESQDPIAPTQTLTYTIAYQNTGTASATGVTISDTVPTNTTFSSATAGGTLNAGVVTWTIGTVTAGTSASVQLLVSVNSPLSDGTILTNGTYSIASNELATVNGAAVTTTVTSQPVLSISKTDSPDPVTPGATTITYTLSYSNTGTANATTTVVTDTIPAGTTFQSATGGGSLGGGVVTWNIGTVNVGASGSVQLVVTANTPLQNGTVIHNSTYNIDSDQTNLLAGIDDTTTVSVPQVAGGLQYPLTARTIHWPAQQNFQGNAATEVDYTIPDPTTPPAGSVLAGTSSCTVGEGHQLAIYEMNSSGITKISGPSATLTPGSAGVRILRATRPGLNAKTTFWGVAWAKATEGFGTWRTCVTGTAQDASQNSVAAVSTTFNCSCQVGNVVQTTNSTGIRTTARVDSANGIAKFGSFNSSITRNPLTELQNWINFSGLTLPTFSLDAGVTNIMMYPMIGNEVHVCKAGCTYSTIASALTAITDAANNKRYTIVVHAGDYSETVGMKSYVSIVGTGMDSTRIQSITQTSSDQVEVGIYNLTLGSGGGGNGTTPRALYIAGCKIGIIDGSAPWGDTLRAFSTGQTTTVYSSGNLYRGKNSALEIYADGDFRSRGDHFIVNSAASTGSPAGAPNPTACGILRDESGARGDIAGAIIEVTSTSTTEPAAGLGCIYAPVFAASRTSRMKVVGSTIRVTGTNASRNANLSCLTVPTGTCAETSAAADSWELRDVDCVVEAADSSSTLRGIHFPSDADHVNWTQTFEGGSIQLTGGATRYDVDNADTASGSSTTLINVQRAGALNGAGKTYTVGNYPAAACSAKCTVGQECTNTSPALCLCTAADTWTKVSGGGACP